MGVGWAYRRYTGLGGGEEGTLNAERLFGNHTWGKNWADGYEPLNSLDADASGTLVGEELKNIYVWVDVNSDASVNSGEIKTLNSLGIVEISATPVRDTSGNANAKEGFKRSDGTYGATWDWWSGQANPSEDYEISVYEWGPIDENSKVPGGEFVFMQYPDDRLELMSFVPMAEMSGDGEAGLFGILFQVKRDGLRMEWRTQNGDLEFVTTCVLEGDNIVGLTRTLAKGKEIDRYGWVALPKTTKRLARY